MTETEYQEWLKKAPQDHFSEEFIQFLRDKPNKVIEETDGWLIIQNIKDPRDFTAFYKGDPFEGIGKLQELVANYYPREWKIKAPHKRSVKLFHVHLIEKAEPKWNCDCGTYNRRGYHAKYCQEYKKI